jgi:predicted amidohydrolase YtcJ
MNKATLVLLVCSALSATAADLVLRNGKILTLDPAQPEVQALAITGGKIVARGSNAQIAPQITPATKVIDLAGRLATPGLIEGHGHFTGVGQAKMALNLRDVKSWDEIVSMVAAAAKEAKPGEWIVGRGWHQEKWDKRPVPNVNGFPVHDELSKVSPNNPVMLTHASGHASFVNEAALKAAGVTKETPNPPGGDIMKDASGRPIGLLNERAQGLTREAMNRHLAQRTVEEREAVLQKEIDLAAQEAVSKGITSFQDAGTDASGIERFRKRAEAGTLPLRLWVMLREPTRELAIDAPKVRMLGAGDDHLTVRAIKHQIDGALGTRGALLLAPYSDLPSTSGQPTNDPKDLEAQAAIAIANGYQLCIHAIGDGGNRIVLDLYEKIFKANPAVKDPRWRVEHAQHIDPADIPRFGKLGVIASMQAVHATSDGPMVLPRLGEKRAREGAYVWQSLMKSGAHVSQGTDAPVEDVNPIENFYAAVTRKMKNGQPFYPEQKLSRMEALRSYTVENAYAAFEENLKGQLKVGMLGDVTVFSKDIMTVPEDEILKTEIAYTVVGGKIAYQR